MRTVVEPTDRSFEELLVLAGSDEKKLLELAMDDLHSHNLADEGISVAFESTKLKIDECLAVIRLLGKKYPEVTFRDNYPCV